MKPAPASRALLWRSRAAFADAVVLSTRIVPRLMPASAPLSPSTTLRKSLSFRTQTKTISFPFAASRGVFAVLPPNFFAHFAALAAVRLYTATSCPRLLRWPAIGYPTTPNPMNATFTISFLPLEHLLIWCREVVVDVLPRLLRRRAQQTPHP